jgi:hypothetical protein
VGDELLGDSESEEAVEDGVDADEVSEDSSEDVAGPGYGVAAGAVGGGMEMDSREGVPASAPALGGKLRLLVQLPSGTALPVVACGEASAAELREAVLSRCGLPAVLAGKLGLALGHAALDEARSLLANDVRDGDTLSLYERA